jgi:hypothetical protein
MAKWDVEVTVNIDLDFKVEAETEDLAITEALKQYKEEYPSLDVDKLYERGIIEVNAWEIENG